jgi:2-oxoglutarate dehydrogenase E2 component (dihydrolipoamide succinyltransferase)
MAKVDLIMPKMGESIMEATILKWVKQVGDKVELDETILEIATDKVDSEIPSPVEGVISEILFQEEDVVEIGKVIARIATEGEDVQPSPSVQKESPATNGADKTEEVIVAKPATPPPVAVPVVSEVVADPVETRPSKSERFYSPLVRNIAAKEGVSKEELDSIQGSGMNGRVTKHDILAYLKTRQTAATQVTKSATPTAAPIQTPSVSAQKPAVSPIIQSFTDGSTEIIQMDRMRKLIADHMVQSWHTSPHVTSYVEADVTNIVNWRNANKNAFQKAYGDKITFTPIFMEAVIMAMHDYPMVNVSVDGDKIIKKNFINLGMATALPNGNLIVPVIKNADYLNLVGLAKSVNDLAKRARENKLKPDEIQGGTFTVTNVGTFGNVMGTPIINQPQVAILAVGAIRKKPAVIETEYGDVIAIRHMMFLSLSYDHRVVDGFLGGSFLRRIADYMEQFDINRTV